VKLLKQNFGQEFVTC